MTGIGDLFAVRRVVVALDAATECLDAMEAAIELAQRMHAELEGLFVEDTSLTRLAGLPFVREVNLLTGAVQQIDVETAERQIRAMADMIHRQLQELAAPHKVRWSFRVMHAASEAELFAAASEGDLIVLGGRTRRITRHAQLEISTVRWMHLAGTPVLLLPGRFMPIRTIAAIVDDGAADRTLAAAAALQSALRESGALAEPARILALCTGASEASAEKTAGKARDILANWNVAADVRALKDGRDTVQATLRSAPDLLVVMAADSPLLSDEEGSRFLEALDQPALLVR